VVQPKAQPHAAKVAQPHAAKVAQPKAQPHAATLAQPKARPHAATVAQPKAQPHAATVAQRGYASAGTAQRMIALAPPALLPAPAPGAARVAFWNTQRLGVGSDAAKQAAATALGAATLAPDVVLCESVGALPAFTIAPVAVGSTHAKKLKYQFAGINWAEVDVVSDYTGAENVFHSEQFRTYASVNLALNINDTKDVAIRRPLIKDFVIGGQQWGFAALHAPAGQERNKTNLSTLFATMQYLCWEYGDRWVLFGDINLDPTAVDVHGNNILAHWVLGSFQLYMDQAVTPLVPAAPTHRRSDGTQNILDFALCPTAVAGNVTLNVIAAAPQGDYSVSDHRPIVITVI
jgi:hypothetical protein